MTRPLSQLIYATIRTGTASAPVITMHDYNQYGPNVAHWGTAASPDGTVTALESYKGVFVGHSVVGYTWFIGPNTGPSPLYFGDALAEIERFLWDYVDRTKQDRPQLPYVIGVGQGGIMAIATALAVPDLISGAIAVDAFLPVVSGWDPPLAPMNDLPMLLVNPKAVSAPRVLAGAALAEQLRAWGAEVDILQQDDATPESLGLDQWLARHGVRTLQPSASSPDTSDR